METCFRVTGPLCGEFYRSPLNSPHKGQWRGAYSLISGRVLAGHDCIWRWVITSKNVNNQAMMTPLNGNSFRVTGPLCGEFTGHRESFPSQRPVTRSFDIFFDLRLNKDWVNNRDAGDLRHNRAHYDVTEMCLLCNHVAICRLVPIHQCQGPLLCFIKMV